MSFEQRLNKLEGMLEEKTPPERWEVVVVWPDGSGIADKGKLSPSEVSDLLAKHDHSLITVVSEGAKRCTEEILAGKRTEAAKPTRNSGMSLAQMLMEGHERSRKGSLSTWGRQSMRDLRVRLARLEQESERRRLFDQTEAPMDLFAPSSSLLREALACLIDCGAISVAGKDPDGLSADTQTRRLLV
jgi:hypothetical protein